MPAPLEPPGSPPSLGGGSGAGPAFLSDLTHEGALPLGLRSGQALVSPVFWRDRAGILFLNDD